MRQFQGVVRRAKRKLDALPAASPLLGVDLPVIILAGLVLSIPLS